MSPISSRIEQVRERMHSLEVDGLILFNVEEASGINIRYLSGFTGTASVCLIRTMPMYSSLILGMIFK